ncbi:glycerophosphodiester phosphodiesterase family protein [Halomonas koreensis]|uniref:Glycerophosphodiester phosphodiesterase family protein n=1 Tax=Halomonas koreensis TaxID=245385 RepID=A0ABU1G4R9_9GAMM|nr:glycerophosphodiester phosphodiesterase family protein [Halomonas koreensis]MDR5867691.1 glycerophosphodiester phosphodiesterase family protein [Halomonas koreensis]
MPVVPSLPRLIAHRGLSARAPENTLAAVRAAHEAGLGWVELDVQLLGDGTPVIWHDRDLKRCSDGRGRLAALDLAAARQLDAGRWFAPAFAGAPMATLEEMLALLAERGMGVNLELKVNRGHDPEALAEAVVPALLAALPADRCLLSSFDVRALTRSRALAGPDRLALGILHKRLPDDWEARCRELAAFSVHTDWRRLSAPRARAVKAAGYALVCYTVNDPDAFAPRWAWGVDAVISDDPTRFR